jgi:hypothetical protein
LYAIAGTFRQSASLRLIAMTVLATHHPLAAAAGSRGISRVLGAPLQYWQSLMKTLFDAYRPELHYMRGPGPKWREKHPDGS